jgi:hypothetical protein
MDQATPVDQRVLWNHRGCGQTPQIWIAITVHVLVAIVKKHLSLPRSLYTILRILSVTLFENTPILQVLSHTDYEEPAGDDRLQSNLFDSRWDTTEF